LYLGIICLPSNEPQSVSHAKNNLREREVFSVKRGRFVAILALSLALFTAIPSYAAKSLDEITSNTSAVTETVAGGQSKQGSLPEFTPDAKGSDVTRQLGDSINLTADTGAISYANKTLGGVIGKLVQLISFIIIFLIPVMTVLDLLYLVSPERLGSILSGGKTASAQGNSGGMGGFGGNSSFGGMSGFGGNSGMGGFGGSSMGNGQQGGHCWVSTDALEALSVGKGKYGYYLKAKVKELLIVPILITLNLTGIMPKIGFALGSILVSAGEWLLKAIGAV
jgi:keratin, type I cytoskeletal 10